MATGSNFNPSGAGLAAPEPVAIVGIGCRLPGASGWPQFWRLLPKGRRLRGHPGLTVLSDRFATLPDNEPGPAHRGGSLDPALVLYTPGTTGRPKAVTWTHARHRYKNIGVHSAKMIFLFTPGGLEEVFVRGGDEPRPGEPAPAWGPEKFGPMQTVVEELGLQADILPEP